MNTKTGRITGLAELMKEFVTNNDMTQDEAQVELGKQIESKELMEIEEMNLTQKQLREHHVSLHDNRSHYGKKFANLRSEQRRINRKSRSQ